MEVPEVFQSSFHHIRRLQRVNTVRASPKIYLLTWNTHGKPPPSDLTTLLRFQDTKQPEIYAIGLQEVGDEWTKPFDKLLSPMDYVRIKSRSLQGLLTLVYVRVDCLPYVTSVESEVTGTGILNMWGNKGAASVRLDFMGLNLIVVNSHLEHAQDRVLERLEDIDAILDYQKFKDRDADNIMDHDYIFWMGDMNFRIDNLTRSEILHHIDTKDFSRLLKNDQLKQVQLEGLAFEDFQEGEIKFPPTYKFDPGTQSYDTSAKQRLPAYCDRILFYFHPVSYGVVQLNASCLQYSSLPSFTTSDHKPVQALVEFSVYSRPPQNPVLFTVQDDWSRLVTNELSYFVHDNFDISSSDWIGLYKKNFTSFNDFTCFTWAATKSVFHKSVSDHTVMHARFTPNQLNPLPVGEYYLCYLTKNFSLCGISSLFKLT